MAKNLCLAADGGVKGKRGNGVALQALLTWGKEIPDEVKIALFGLLGADLSQHSSGAVRSMVYNMVATSRSDEILKLGKLSRTSGSKGKGFRPETPINEVVIYHLASLLWHWSNNGWFKMFAIKNGAFVNDEVLDELAPLGPIKAANLSTWFDVLMKKFEAAYAGRPASLGAHRRAQGPHDLQVIAGNAYKNYLRSCKREEERKNQTKKLTDKQLKFATEQAEKKTRSYLRQRMLVALRQVLKRWETIPELQSHQEALGSFKRKSV